MGHFMADDWETRMPAQDAAISGTTEAPCSASGAIAGGSMLPYLTWRQDYWARHGNTTYREIDLAVERGELTVGDMPNCR